MWLYPVPALVAAGSFVFILVSRTGFLREIRYAAVILIVGIIVYCVRAWRRREWPFGEASLVVSRLLFVERRASREPALSEVEGSGSGVAGRGRPALHQKAKWRK